jgi:hypothetical protein
LLIAGTPGCPAQETGQDGARAGRRERDMPSFSVGIIDLASGRCQAVGMTAHDATRRRYIDQLKTAAALCS